MLIYYKYFLRGEKQMVVHRSVVCVCVCVSAANVSVCGIKKLLLFIDVEDVKDVIDNNNKSVSLSLRTK